MAARLDLHSILGQPQTIVRGAIVSRFPALQVYAVQTASVGLILAVPLFFGGTSAHHPFLVSSHGYAVGTEVLVAFDPVCPSVGIILGGAPEFGMIFNENFLLSAFPLRCGVAYNRDGMYGLYEASMYRQLLDPHRLPSRHSGMLDGDGTQFEIHNPFGGGLLLDAVRASVRGSSVAGVEAIAPNNAVRLYGYHIQIESLRRSLEIGAHGPSLFEHDFGYDLPNDVVYADAPTRIAVGGPPYAGDTTLVSYRKKDNLPHLALSTQNHGGQGGAAQSSPSAFDDNTYAHRTALIHEYRGIDGTYIISAAHSITLQRWSGIVVPEYKPFTQPSAKTRLSNFESIKELVSNEDLKKYDSDDNVYFYANPAHNTRDAPLYKFWIHPFYEYKTPQTYQHADSLATIVAHQTFIAQLVSRQSHASMVRSGVWVLDAQKLPTYLARVMHQHKQYPVFYYRLSWAHWKRPPKSFVINIHSYGLRRRLFLGRSMISLTPTGGVIIQDAWGSQIVMSGGNIIFQAEHDIIVQNGRDYLVLAGRDIAQTAYRHHETSAMSGRHAASSGSSMVLASGLSGAGGLTIQNHASGSGFIENESGKPHALSGGIRVYSRGSVYLGSSHADVAIHTPGALVCNARHGTLVMSGQGDVAINGASLLLTDTESGATAYMTASGLSISSISTVYLSSVGQAIINSASTFSAALHAQISPSQRFRETVMAAEAQASSWFATTPSLATAHHALTVEWALPIAPWQQFLLSQPDLADHIGRHELPSYATSLPPPGVPWWNGAHVYTSGAVDDYQHLYQLPEDDAAAVQPLQALSLQWISAIALPRAT